jgi:hypothetical protein
LRISPIPGLPRIGYAADPALQVAAARVDSRRPGKARRWPPACDGERSSDEEAQHRIEPAAKKEHAMMFAFALALVGVAVLGSLELAATRAR